MRDLIDPEDGENRAVRAFLMHYGAPGLTVKQQRDNMRRAGWECWPAWVADVDGHLTKLGAQNWLRYLFGLESAAGVPASQRPRAFVGQPLSTDPPALIGAKEMAFGATVHGTPKPDEWAGYRERCQHGVRWENRCGTCAAAGVLVLHAPGARLCTHEEMQAAIERGDAATFALPGAAGVTPTVPARPRGVHALAAVVSNLLQTGRYSDEEGEATAELLDLLKSLTDGALVPATPTQAMLDAADKVLDSDPRHIAEAWRAMVAAAGVPGTLKDKP